MYELTIQARAEISKAWTAIVKLEEEVKRQRRAQVRIVRRLLREETAVKKLEAAVADLAASLERKKQN